MENNQQNFDEKYQVKSEIDHILDRPGMWLGSTEFEIMDSLLYKPSEHKITLVEKVTHNAGLVKLVDEVLSNSVDEFRRKDSLFHITKITVDVKKNGIITIRDNGGIPVKTHKQTGILIPKLIFGQLRTSSNYDDTQEREVVGTNGLGSKLTNVFSEFFHVTTADGKSEYSCKWVNNMREIADETIITSKEHFTEISFKIELSRFDLDVLPMSIIRVIQKRCIDSAAANAGLEVVFTSDISDGVLNSTWKFTNFREYLKLYLTQVQEEHLMQYKNNLFVLPVNLGFDVAFVNGALCCEGTHIKKIQKQLTEELLKLCLKNDMELITEKDILARISLFVNCTITNPQYDSQSKDKLTSKLDRHILAFDDEFIKSLKDSEIYKSLQDFYEAKYAEEKRKETRKLNASLKTTKIKKLIQCADKTGSNNELWIFEGNSASNGFKANRNYNQAAYLLRGKITNTFNLGRSQILENQELREVIASLGILFGEAQKNLKLLKFDKVVFATDMDFDGHHICGLLLAFFCKHFPELVMAGKVYRALSPIVIARKGAGAKQDVKYYYTLTEYEAENPKNLSGYEIIYTKGLGGLSTADYRQMLRNQKLLKFTIEDKQDLESVMVWFDKSTEQRKLILLEDNNEISA